MSLQGMARVDVLVLAMLTGSVALGWSQQTPYYGNQTVYGGPGHPPPNVIQPHPPVQQQRVPGAAYTVPVRPCGVFGKPPCGTVVTIPAGATGASLFGLAKNSQAAGRTWEAMIYVDQSAIMGYVPAESALGADFAGGAGIPKDLVKARYWLQKAADQGDGASQAELGEFYELAEGGPPDTAKAVRYFEMAATQRVPRAEFNLGVLYELGDGVAHDRAKATLLLRQTAEDDRRIGANPARATDYANALSRAGARRFSDAGQLAAYVYPPPRQTQTRQAGVPAGCPGEPSYPIQSMGWATFCSRNPGCPYRKGGLENVCPRFPNGYGVN